MGVYFHEQQPKCMDYDTSPLIGVLCMLAGMEKINIHCHPTICSILYMAILFKLLCNWDSNILPALLWQCLPHTELIACRYFWSMSHYQIFLRQQKTETHTKPPNTSRAWLPSKAAGFCLSKTVLPGLYNPCSLSYKGGPQHSIVKKSQLFLGECRSLLS